MAPSIAILGAGPSGLTLARILEVNNIHYTVFDRDESPDASGQGGTLDIRTDGGQRALKECGLFETFQSLARYDGQAFKALDKDGTVIWDKAADGRDEMPEIDRKELRRLLLESVPSDKIQWNARIEGVSPSESGSIAIRFADRRHEQTFKLVVGADGTWSKARAVLTPVRPRFSGLSYLNTTITRSNPNYHALSARIGLGSYMAISEGKSIIAQRMGDGSYNVYAGLKLPENWSKANADFIYSPDFRQHLVSKEFAGWSSEITDLVKLSDGSFHTWPLYSLPADALCWQTNPSVCLVGDAAHVSLPNGEGVNCGMLDGMELGQEIVRCGVDHLDEAVRRYEEKLLPRGIEHINDGEQMTKMFYEEGAPKAFKAWLAGMGEAIES